MKKELKIEWRNKYALNGILLYLVSTIFICYLSFNVKYNQLNVVTWNALFWIIILFASINAVAKSFIQEKQERLLYYYTIISPQALIFARIIYNALLLVLVALLGFFFYGLILGNPVVNTWLFVAIILLASVGFSSTLTLISAIASKAGNNQTLMAVLGFPIILPMLLMVIKVSKNAIDGLELSASLDELITLLAINIIVGAVSFLLFPYLWRS
ncbi:heme exporter protein CcmB [Fulvivirga lutimaris]|uniref:heme exporter protein CcmB n=1 Tax=Fulvivirga lutimaris TaxID=1819566 RepID=UPI001624B063|nr:ABC transporter permease [Fulvivirga lutimaris]